MKRTFFLVLGLVIALFALNACDILGGDDDNEPQVDLPTTIEIFIASNYPDYEIDEAEKETDCTGEEVFEVELESSNDDEIELTFDLEGNLLYTETEINIDELPEAVTTTISTEYPDFKLDDAERLDLATDGVEYEVELEKGKTELEVRLSATGTVICEEED